VLYVRGEATRLFTFTAAPTAPPEHQLDARSRATTAVQPTQQAAQRRAELRALYVEARAELRLEHFDTAIGLFDDLLTLDPHYLDAADLRDTARRGGHLAGIYALAGEAEDAGDWIAAIRAYDEILQAEPAYRDAATRKEACEARQRIDDLQAELRHHAAADRWQTVLDVAEELTRMDASAADPGGLATRARDALVSAQRTADLERRYAEARAAEDAGNWTAAAEGYGEILASAPAYRDAVKRKEACQHRQQVAQLQADLDERSAAKDWPRLLTTMEKLAELDSTAAAEPPYIELVARARQELAVARPEPLQRINCSWNVQEVCWHPAGNHIAVATVSAWVRVYDTSGQEHLKVKAGTWRTRTFAVAFSSDGTRLAAGGEDNNTARVWDATSGAKLLEVRHDGAVWGVAFSPDGSRLATCSLDRTARVWDVSSGAKLLEVRHGETVPSVAFSPDGSRLATGSLDRTARVWDVSSGAKLLEVPHEDVVDSVAFSPDGRRLATGSRDCTARVWDVSSGAKLLEVRHDKKVSTVAFSPNGTRLATGSFDDTVRIWPIG